MTPGRAVVVTGAGCTLPGSPTPQALWRRLARAETAVSAYANPRVEPGRLRCFGHVDAGLSEQSREAVPFKLRRYAGPCSQWGVRAAAAAVADAGLDLDRVPQERRGVFASQGDYQYPSLPSFEDGLAAIRRRGGRADPASLAHEFLRERGAEPFFAVKSLANNLLAVVSMALRLRGDCGAFVQDENAAWAALRSAVLSLRHGDCDVAVVACAGSFDEPLTLAELRAQGRLSDCAEGPASLRPFDAGRDGGIPGEGAVALVLETADHAAARQAAPLAVVSGMGGIEAGDDLAYARIARQAASEAGVPLAEVDAIVAGGRGEREADAREARMLRALPGASAARPITAATPITGSVPGCPVGLLAAISMLRHQQVPPIAHLGRPEETALNWVMGAPIARRLRRLLVLDAGWLGCHSAVLLSQPGTPE